jgi:hypothetical protein
MFDLMSSLDATLRRGPAAVERDRSLQVDVRSPVQRLD